MKVLIEAAEKIAREEKIEYKIEYYLTYDLDNGNALFFYAGPSMHKNSIKVTEEQYNTLRCQYIYVEDGVIQNKKLDEAALLQLIKHPDGEFHTTLNNMIFIVDPSEEEFDSYTRSKND